MKNALVYISRISSNNRNMDQKVFQICDFLIDNRKFNLGGKKVFIKPNFTANMVSGSGAVTDIKLVRSIALWALKKEAKVAFGDGPAIGFKSKEVFDTCGATFLANELEIPLVDLNEDKTIRIKSPWSNLPYISISKTVAISDLLINVPVMKTHYATLVSLGLKNLKGILPRKYKKYFHQKGLEECIAALAASIRPYITLVDGLVAMEGFGPLYGNPRELNIILAGCDPVAVDSVCAKIMGLNPNKIYHISKASKYGVGIDKLENIEIKGECLSSLTHTFIMPKEFLLKSFPNVKIFSFGECSGCLGSISAALKKLKVKINYSDFRCNIFTGPKVNNYYNLNKSSLLVGKCIKKNKYFFNLVDGCPPSSKDIENLLIKIYEAQL